MKWVIPVIFQGSCRKFKKIRRGLMGERKKEGSLDREKGKRRGGISLCLPIPSLLYPPCPFPCSFCSYCFWRISLREGRKAPGRVFILWGWLVGPVSLRLEWASHEVSVGRIRLLLEEVFSWILCSEFYGFFLTSVCLCVFGKMLNSCLDFFPYFEERENNYPIRFLWGDSKIMQNHLIQEVFFLVAGK